MKISRLKPLLRALVVGKTRLKRNLLIFITAKRCHCCAVQPCRVTIEIKSHKVVSGIFPEPGWRNLFLRDILQNAGGNVNKILDLIFRWYAMNIFFLKKTKCYTMETIYSPLACLLEIAMARCGKCAVDIFSPLAGITHDNRI